jgi:rubrerythrin
LIGTQDIGEKVRKEVSNEKSKKKEIQEILITVICPNCKKRVIASDGRCPNCGYVIN